MKISEAEVRTGLRAARYVTTTRVETAVFVALVLEKAIPFTTASDAHSHAQLAEDFDRLAEKMSILGIREVCVYEKHQRQLVML